MRHEFKHHAISTETTFHVELSPERHQGKRKTEEQQNAAIDAVIAEAGQKVVKRIWRFGFNLTVIPPLTLILAVLPIFINKFKMDGIVGPYIAHVTILLIAACILIFRDSLQPFPFNTEELTRIGGIKAIGTLMEACEMNICSAQKRALYSALIPLLLELKASDDHILSPEHHQQIRYRLTPEPQGVRVTAERLKLKLAHLKALEQVGDKESIPTVQLLANMKARTERQRQIKEAAQDCLLHLEARLGIDSAKTTLLRGSSSEPTPSNTLLRPANPENETLSEQLLRPTDEE